MLRHAEPLDIELQESPHKRDHRSTRERPDHRTVTAENRSAADDHRCDGIELAELAGYRIEAAVIGNIDDARHRGAESREHEGDEAYSVGIDAGIGRGADIAARRIDLLAEGRIGEHDPG